tara:strand:- start:226 stop:921 length:696 start_codon:yes stop_codon:yes gene_type:complete
MGKPLLERLIERVKYASRMDKLVVATTVLCEDDEIVDLAKRLNVDVFRGPVNDVLKRYVECAGLVNADVVVRLTGDNPLTDPILIDRAIDHHLRTGVDYTCCKHPGATLLGTGNEIVSVGTLRKIEKLAKGSYFREHVTPFILENPSLFKISFLNGDRIFNREDIRLTVDTEQDLELIRKVYAQLSKSENLIDLVDVVNLADSDSEFFKVNVNAEQKEDSYGKFAGSGEGY